MNLVPNTKKEEVVEIRNVKKEVPDRQYAGRIRKKRGQVLFGMCHKTFEVYEVKKKLIESKVAKVDFSTGDVKGKAKKEEYIYIKGDPVLYALNMKNAVRKFQKMVDRYYK